MASRNDVEVLRICVEELRRLYDSVSVSFEQLRTKALALIAGEVAIIAFLFSPNSGRFFISPAPVYGFVIFGIGLALLALSFIMLLTVISTVSWTHPPDEKDIKDLNNKFKTEESFLTALKDDYMQAIAHCIKKTNARSIRFMIGVYSLSGGFALLVLIKYLGNLIK